MVAPPIAGVKSLLTSKWSESPWGEACRDRPHGHRSENGVSGDLRAAPRVGHYSPGEHRARSAHLPLTAFHEIYPVLKRVCGSNPALSRQNSAPAAKYIRMVGMQPVDRITWNPNEMERPAVHPRDEADGASSRGSRGNVSEPGRPLPELSRALARRSSGGAGVRGRES